MELDFSAKDNKQNYCVGKFANEKESHAEFYRIASVCGCFSVIQKPHTRTTRILYLPHWRNEKKWLEPDFLLTPSQRLIDAGWPAADSIVVDAKRSEKKIGPGLSQLIDYLNAEYEVYGEIVRPSWAFLWPALPQHSATASLMAHQRVGNVSAGWIHGSEGMAKLDELKFYCGESRILTIAQCGQRIDVAEHGLKIGKRSGSR